MVEQVDVVEVHKEDRPTMNYRRQWACHLLVAQAEVGILVVVGMAYHLLLGKGSVHLEGIDHLQGTHHHQLEGNHQV